MDVNELGPAGPPGALPGMTLGGAEAGGADAAFGAVP